MNRIQALVEQAIAPLAELARMDVASLGDAGLVAVLESAERAGRLLDATRASVAAEVSHRSRHELGTAGLSFRLGERKPGLFLERVARVSGGEVARRVRVGDAVREHTTLSGEVMPPKFPVLARALLSGEVGMESADRIVTALTHAADGCEASVENVVAAEESLVGIAKTDSPELVGVAARRWRDALDPDGIEPRYEDVLSRQGVFIGRERAGIRKYTINAAPVLAATLDAVFQNSLDRSAAPRFISDADLESATREMIDDHGHGVQVVTDPRSMARQRADILAGVLDVALRATRTGNPTLRTVGQVIATIPLADLISGVGAGQLDGVEEAIPAEVIRQLVCESGYDPVVLDHNGQPLHLGHTVRHASTGQRKALIARDGSHCASPGCRTRAALCHAHHIRFHSRGGPTNIDNLILLCPAHHTALHQGALSVTPTSGRPVVHRHSIAHRPALWQAPPRQAHAR